MKVLHFFLLFSIISLLSISIDHSFADHGSGGGSGGGCTGDCIPPTMGIDEYLRQGVSNGFTINGKSFDVEHFKQDIPTQVYGIGEPVEISLVINENSGAFYLTNVQLLLGEKEELVGGQLIPTYPVQIIWEKTLDGEESFFVIDKNEHVSNVTVKSFVDGDPVIEKTTTLTFSFVPVKVFDSSPIVVKMWDYNRSAWTNYFYNALEISSDISNPGLMEFSEDKKLILPSWIKNNAGFWADNLIDDATFVTGIKYCIDNNLIKIPDLPAYSPENVLHFVDVTKGPKHYIDRYYNEPSYKDWFDVNFPDYTIEEAVGLEPNSSHEIPDWIKNNASWWAAGEIDDTAFVTGIEYLVKNGIIVV